MLKQSGLGNAKLDGNAIKPFLDITIGAFSQVKIYVFIKNAETAVLLQPSKDKADY